MSDFQLRAQAESSALFAGLFELALTTDCTLEVTEDACFPSGKWLNVGRVSLKPEPPEGSEADRALFRSAVELGFYEWSIPPIDKLKADLFAILALADDPPQKEKSKIERQRRKATTALEAVPQVAVRLGLVHPVFDAGIVSQMPFRWPVTVVADTTSILEGALDFVSKFLYPMARVKVPAITHMEIITWADNYMKYRRAGTVPGKEGAVLSEHVRSQGAHRVLLRLELQSDTEVERPRLGADPLRGVVTSQSDSEDTSLGLQETVRSFADRLILETAVQHRDRVASEHLVMVITCDQGLARMALAEGLQPLFFDKNHLRRVFGSTVRGTAFRPFVALSQPRLYSVPLTALLWELASTFGAARLRTDDGKFVEVAAMGSTLSWHPHHSHDDLLWVRVSSAPAPPTPRAKTVAPSPQDGPSTVSQIADSTQKKRARQPQTPAAPKPLTGSYRFGVPAMLRLIQLFADKVRVSDKDAMAALKLAPPGYQDYKKFLMAGHFVSSVEDGLMKEPALDNLWGAIRRIDNLEINASLTRVPSYAALISSRPVGQIVRPGKESGVSETAFPAYSTLAEIAGRGLDIYKEGLFLTPADPNPQEFAASALAAYRKLRRGEDYVLTGAWLEELARGYGIHPNKARESLAKAHEIGMIERYTEGSTPETRYDQHKMSTLIRDDSGFPNIRETYLYRGDFILPGKSSVRIHLKEKRE